MNLVPEMYKNVIENLHSIQESRLSTISFNNNRLSLPKNLPTYTDGLYWIYTDYSDQDLLGASSSTKKNAVNFNSLVQRHTGLTNLCKQAVNDFRVVYNGIGGCGLKGSGGLRERILAEFRGGVGTGSLAINDSSLNNLVRWRFSYVLWSEIQFPQAHTYIDYAETIERLWRIHYGWPILCTK